MGPPPRSLTAEANSCFMVRVPHGPNRIQGCGASIAPERGLPSDQLYRTSNNEGNRVAVTLDTNVLIQGCVKTRGSSIAIEQVSRSRPFQVPALQAHSISRSNSTRQFDRLEVFLKTRPSLTQIRDGARSSGFKNSTLSALAVAFYAFGVRTPWLSRATSWE